MTPINWATHLLQWNITKFNKKENFKLYQKFPQFGLKAATRFHEAGITSNRESERHGEYVN